jgi:hypothetical protein
MHILFVLEQRTIERWDDLVLIATQRLWRDILRNQ